MKIEFHPGNETATITEAFNGVALETEEGNRISVCMRDDTFEIKIHGMPNWHRVDLLNNRIYELI